MKITYSVKTKDNQFVNRFTISGSKSEAYMAISNSFFYSRFSNFNALVDIVLQALTACTFPDKKSVENLKILASSTFRIHHDNREHVYDDCSKDVFAKAFEIFNRRLRLNAACLFVHDYIKDSLGGTTITYSDLRGYLTEFDLNRAVRNKYGVAFIGNTYSFTSPTNSCSKIKIERRLIGHDVETEIFSPSSVSFSSQEEYLHWSLITEVKHYFISSSIIEESLNEWKKGSLEPYRLFIERFAELTA